MILGSVLTKCPRGFAPLHSPLGVDLVRTIHEREGRPRGLFFADIAPGALWYCLGVGRVSSCFLAAHMTDLAPPQRGFFYDQRNQRCGWAFGWWACVLERQARYGNKHDPPSPANLAGLLFGDPCPLRWLPADARRMPRATQRRPLVSFLAGGSGPAGRKTRWGELRRAGAAAGG